MRGLKGRKRTEILFSDEVIITETPPLRAAWSKIGQPLEVPITGNHDKRVLYGTLSLQGAIELYYAKEWDQDHFQAISGRSASAGVQPLACSLTRLVLLKLVPQQSELCRWAAINHSSSFDILILVKIIGHN